MLEKPRLEDEKIFACLKNSYALDVTALEFLPLGYDSYAGVYRVQANEQTYFLKVKGDTVDELSVRLPRYLKEQGIEQIVAPLPTMRQEPWSQIDHFTLILYPFIDGQNGVTVGLSGSQWIEFGAVLKKLHAMRLPPNLLNRMPKETFIPHPKWNAVVRQLQATVGTRAYDNPVERQFAMFWEDKAQEIGRIVDRAEQLGRMLQAKPLDFVVCHADIHTGNLLLDSHDKLFVVDWDQPILAPRERDLMFVMVGGFAPGPREKTLFFRGYGKTDVDRLALAYYAYERAMEDLGGFGEHVLLMDTGDEAKQESVKWCMKMFEPGNIVEAAHRLDQALND